MFDTKLPFGASVSPTVFHRLTKAVRCMMGLMANRGFPNVVTYQDDFCIVGESYHRVTIPLLPYQGSYSFEAIRSFLVSKCLE